MDPGDHHDPDAHEQHPGEAEIDAATDGEIALKRQQRQQTEKQEGMRAVTVHAERRGATGERCRGRDRETDTERRGNADADPPDEDDVGVRRLGHGTGRGGAVA